MEMNLSKEELEGFATALEKQIESNFTKGIGQALGHELDDAERDEAIYTLAAIRRYAERRADIALGPGDGSWDHAYTRLLMQTRLFDEVMRDCETADGYNFWKELLG